MSYELPTLAERKMARRLRLSSHQWYRVTAVLGMKGFLLLTERQRINLINETLGRGEKRQKAIREDEARIDKMIGLMSRSGR